MKLRIYVANFITHTSIHLTILDEMGRSRIRKSSSLSSLVTVLLMLDLVGDNGNVPPVCLPVTFLMAAP